MAAFSWRSIPALLTYSVIVILSVYFHPSLAGEEGGVNWQPASGSWRINWNTQISSGDGTVSAASTQYDCQNACDQTTWCLGIDWAPNGATGQQCWLFKTSGVTMGGSGVRHYDFTRRGDVVKDEYFVNWLHSETRSPKVTLSITYRFQCKLQDVSDTDVVRIVHKQGNTFRTISENGELKPPFSKLQRYVVEFNRDEEKKTAVVNLRYEHEGIQREDGGILTCFNANNDVRNLKETNFLNLTVSVHVSDIYFIAISPNGSESHFNETPVKTRVEIVENVFVEDKSRIGCVAVNDGSRIPPIISMVVFNNIEPHFADVDKNVDISHLFSYSGGTKLGYMADSGLRRYDSYNKSVIANTSSVADLYGKRLGCYAVPIDFNQFSSPKPISVILIKPSNGTNRKEHFGFKRFVLLALFSFILVF